MDKVKVLIEISGGVLQAVHSNVDLEYILVDYDNLDNNEIDFDNNPFGTNDSFPYGSDSVRENLWEVYDGFQSSLNEPECIIRAKLKEINF